MTEQTSQEEVGPDGLTDTQRNAVGFEETSYLTPKKAYKNTINPRRTFIQKAALVTGSTILLLGMAVSSVVMAFENPEVNKTGNSEEVENGSTGTAPSYSEAAFENAYFGSAAVLADLGNTIYGQLAEQFGENSQEIAGILPTSSEDYEIVERNGKSTVVVAGKLANIPKAFDTENSLEEITAVIKDEENWSSQELTGNFDTETFSPDEKFLHGISMTGASFVEEIYTVIKVIYTTSPDGSINAHVIIATEITEPPTQEAPAPIATK